MDQLQQQHQITKNLAIIDGTVQCAGEQVNNE